MASVIQIQCPKCGAPLNIDLRTFEDFNAETDTGEPFLMPIAQCDACEILVLFPGDQPVTVLRMVQP
jgi:hypothetical protein